MRFADRLRQLAARRALPAASLCLLILPLALLYARALAEILLGIVDALFLLRCWAGRDWCWAGTAFARAALAWWLWQIMCSAVGTGGLVLALVAFRLPLFAIALGLWVLQGARSRRALWWVLAASVGWIVLETWQQAVLGQNIFGQPRWGDGALTGPFNRPRAGPALILTLFPVLLPAASWLMARPGLIWRASGALLAGLGVASVLLIGQRMPSLLVLLGLILTAILLPRLRLGAALAGAVGVVLVAALPVAAPDTYHKLVTRTQEQLTNFVYSPYGELWVRATVIARQHPWTGLGFDGFRRGCHDPQTVQGLPALGVTLAEARLATDACNIHPHNYYLEAADNGGLPLLACFMAMVAAAWIRLARGLRSGRDPLRAGLLVGFTLAMWPVASTSAFTSMPNAGWVFLLLGFGLSEGEAVLF